MNIVRAALITILILLTGCVSKALDPATTIVGQWRSEVAGFPVTLSYSETTVQVGSAAPVSYTLSGNELQFAGGASQVRIVRFPSKNKMIQTDPLTGTEHAFTRN